MEAFRRYLPQVVPLVRIADIISENGLMVTGQGVSEYVATDLVIGINTGCSSRKAATRTIAVLKEVKFCPILWFSNQMYWFEQTLLSVNGSRMRTASPHVTKSRSRNVRLPSAREMSETRYEPFVLSWAVI